MTTPNPTTPTNPNDSGANTIFSGGCHEYCNNVKWVITDQWIQREKGVCCKSIDNLQLIRVKDIHFHSRCCCESCGVITIYSTDETNPILPIVGIPNGKDVYHKLRDAISKLQSGGKTQIEIKA